MIPYYGFGSDTSVGAILRFFCEVLVSSLSFSTASLLMPAAILALPGVSGGVVMGTPVTLPELAAVMLGTLPPMRGGLFITEACVATDDAEFDRVGDGGRAFPYDVVGGGDGAGNEVAEFRCWWLGNGEGGAKSEVGVGIGVAWLDVVPVEIDEAFLALTNSPSYSWPNSPGVKERVEQKPSEEEISSVEPSVDLANC